MLLDSAASLSAVLAAPRPAPAPAPPPHAPPPPPPPLWLLNPPRATATTDHPLAQHITTTSPPHHHPQVFALLAFAPVAGTRQKCAGSELKYDGKRQLQKKNPDVLLPRCRTATLTPCPSFPCSADIDNSKFFLFVSIMLFLVALALIVAYLVAFDFLLNFPAPFSFWTVVGGLFMSREDHSSAKSLHARETKPSPRSSQTLRRPTAGAVVQRKLGIYVAAGRCAVCQGGQPAPALHLSLKPSCFPSLGQACLTPPPPPPLLLLLLFLFPVPLGDQQCQGRRQEAWQPVRRQLCRLGIRRCHALLRVRLSRPSSSPSQPQHDISPADETPLAPKVLHPPGQLLLRVQGDQGPAVGCPCPRCSLRPPPSPFSLSPPSL